MATPTIHGNLPDTGLLDISHLLSPDWERPGTSASRCAIQRVGNLVTVQFRIQRVATSAPGLGVSTVLFPEIPQGFRDPEYVPRGVARCVSGNNTIIASVLKTTGNNLAAWGGSAAGSWSEGATAWGSASWNTSDSWPVLPI